MSDEKFFIRGVENGTTGVWHISNPADLYNSRATLCGVISELEYHVRPKFQVPEGSPRCGECAELPYPNSHLHLYDEGKRAYTVFGKMCDASIITFEDEVCSLGKTLADVR